MGRAEKGLEEIEGMLEPGEEVKAHVFGTQCDPPTSKRGKVAGALAVTDRRFLFVGKSIASKKVHGIPLDTVTSVELNKGAMFSHVQVTLAGSYENFLVKYKEAEPFVQVAHPLWHLLIAAAPKRPQRRPWPTRSRNLPTCISRVCCPTKNSRRRRPACSALSP